MIAAAVVLEAKMLQQFRQDLIAGALIHGFLDPCAFALGKEPIAPPDQGSWRLAEDFRLLEDRQRDHPGRVPQSEKSAASRAAVGEVGDLIEEFLCRSW